MSRTYRGSKGAGYEYWSRRPTKGHWCCEPGRYAKRLTHRLERIEGKRQSNAHE